MSNVEYPTLNKDIVFYNTNDINYMHVYNPLNERHYKMGVEEVTWLRLFDGSKTDEELIEKSKIDIEITELREFYEKAKSLGFFTEKKTKKKQCFDIKNILQIKIKFGNPDHVLSKYPILIALITGYLRYSTLPLTICTIILSVFNAQKFSLGLDGFSINIYSYLLFLLAFFIIGSIHELSHAIVAKYYGAHIPAVGIMLLFFNPAMYVDLSGINFINGTWKKVFAFLAGIIAQVNLASLIIIAFIIGGTPGVAWGYLLMVAIGCITGAIFNLIPFIKLDGYHVVVAMLRIPKLFENAFSYVSSIFRISANKQIKTFSRDEKMLFILYWLTSILFMPVCIFSGILFVSSLLFGNTLNNAIQVITIIVAAFLSALSLFITVSQTFNKFKSKSNGVKIEADILVKKASQKSSLYFLICFFSIFIPLLINNVIPANNCNALIIIIFSLTPYIFMALIMANESMEQICLDSIIGCFIIIITLIVFETISVLIIEKNNILLIFNQSDKVTIMDSVRNLCYASSTGFAVFSLYIVLSMFLAGLVIKIAHIFKNRVKIKNTFAGAE